MHHHLRPLAALFALAMLTALPSVAAAQAVTTAPTHLRVVWHERPATEAVFAWSTSTDGTTHRVHLDTVSRAGDVSQYARTVDSRATGIYSDDHDPRYHHVAVDSLQPSTRYYFVVESDGEVSEERWFVTAPTDDRRFVLLYGGDSRSDRQMRRVMNERIEALFAADEDVIALVHGGDYIDDGYDWLEWQEWLEDYELTERADGRVLPIVPARGNHERDGVIYNHVFGMPGGTMRRNYFTTKLGAHLALITLDSEGVLFGDQRNWLERELIDHRETTWVFASYHTPAYPAVKIPGPTKFAFVPLFDRYDVDIVFENDGHALKRTVPIRNDEPTEGGVVYVGEGGLGVKQREPDATRWWVQSPGMTKSAHHVQRVTVTPTEVLYEAVLADGSVDDSETFTPKRREDPLALTPFEVTEVKSSLDGKEIRMTFSVAYDSATVTRDTVSIDKGLELEDIYITPPAFTLLRLRPTPAHTPGETYTITLDGVEDLAGRPLVNSVITFSVPGGEGEEDMGTTPAPEPDMGGVSVDDMLKMDGPTDDGSDSDSASGPGGCSTSERAGSSGAALLVAMVLGGLFLRRRRSSDQRSRI